jgi:protein-tyrosine phosphatase
MIAYQPAWRRPIARAFRRTAQAPVRLCVRLGIHANLVSYSLSTVLTWQHHLVDVAGGFVLGGFAFYLFRESGPRLPVVRNMRIGGYYAAGGAAMLALASLLWPWGVFLLWPAGSLAIVAAAYFGLGPGIFRKAGGRFAPSARFVLAPVLIGQHLSLAYYRRQCRAWDEVAPGVWIGRVLTREESAAAVAQGVTGVLDLTAEFSETAPFRTTRYRNLPILDLTAPRPKQLDQAAQFIAEEVASGVVYVHCKIGSSRSAAVAAAYLLESRQARTVEEAIARLRLVRPTIIIRPETALALRAFALRDSADRAHSHSSGCLVPFLPAQHSS